MKSIRKFFAMAALAGAFLMGIMALSTATASATGTCTGSGTKQIARPAPKPSVMPRRCSDHRRLSPSQWAKGRAYQRSRMRWTRPPRLRMNGRSMRARHSSSTGATGAPTPFALPAAAGFA